VPFGRYLLLEKIASGGMAEVFRAVLRGAAGFEKRVALKRILPVFSEEPGFITLFQDEARIASTLGHGNIAQVFEFGEVDGAYYIALELVDGLDLAKLVARLRAAGQPMPLATAAFIVAEAARGLAYAHEQRRPDGALVGIVHRDVSPPNLLISRTGEVKVADFGIAKAAGKVHKTETGVIMGKLRYMSPEQIALEPGAALDARSDIFSLGVILYELLTGGPIFPGDQTIRLAELIRTAPIVPPSLRNPDVPPELDAITLRALGRPRDARYPRAAELARDLMQFVSRSAPGFTPDDLAALVSAHAPQPPVEQAPTELALAAPPSQPKPVREEPHAETRSLRAPATVTRRRRRSSGASRLFLALLAIIAVSGGLVLWRFFLPGRDAALPDAAKLTLATVDAGARPPDPIPSAPFTLVPSVPADARAALVAKVDAEMVTRRGLLTPDYARYLTELDGALAALVVDGEGHGVAPEVRSAPVAATIEHVARTGELPPLVLGALRSFLAGKPALAQGAAPYSAAALAVWLEPRSRQRLVELAHANDVLGRWCAAPEPPARHFAPQLCEPAALVAALRAAHKNDPVAAALERYFASATELPEVAVETARYEGRAVVSEQTLLLTLSADAPAATLLAAGARGEIPMVKTDERGFSAVVPREIFAPVLRVEGATGLLRLPAPPFGD
jgi:serine/threonine protein kinase